MGGKSTIAPDDRRTPGGGYQYSGGGEAGDTRIFGDIILRCWSTVGNAAEDRRLG